MTENRTKRTLLSRQQSLIELLSEQGGFVTAATLAQTLGVSLRTIHRDVATLIAQGTPIRGVTGSGFVLRADEPLTPVALTRSELETALEGLNGLVRDERAGLRAAALSARAKLFVAYARFEHGPRDAPATAPPERHAIGW